MTNQTRRPEKRGEDRKQTRGDVRFALEVLGALAFEGSLIDTSNSGVFAPPIRTRPFPPDSASISATLSARAAR